jgi:hypothetical protein
MLVPARFHAHLPIVKQKAPRNQRFLFQLSFFSPCIPSSPRSNSNNACVAESISYEDSFREAPRFGWIDKGNRTFVLYALILLLPIFLDQGIKLGSRCRICFAPFVRLKHFEKLG